MNDRPNIREPEEENAPERSAPDRRASALRLRRRICIILAVLVVFVVAASLLIHCMDESDTPEEGTFAPAKEQFEEPDYEYDILKDQAYLALDREVYYSDGGYTRPIDESDLPSLDAGVTLLWNMIDCIIAGDADGYNSLFTEKYKSKYGETERFAMQQLYDIRITVGRSEQVTQDDRTVNYQTYYVQYRIRKNNGTFRRDIGDDEARIQIFTLSDRENGAVKIEEIGYRY